MDSDEFRQVRIGVLRRAVFGSNASALMDDRVPPEGLFDAAVANGLAAITAAEIPGQEFDSKGRVRSPLTLLEIVQTVPQLAWINGDLLSEGVELSQGFRHGRAEDEWTRVTSLHIASLVALDDHHALQVMERARAATFDVLVFDLYRDAAEEHLPFDPKERSAVPDPEECPDCGRETLVAEGWDSFGIGLAEGATCIACGYERSHEDAASDAMDRAMERPD